MKVMFNCDFKRRKGYLEEPNLNAPYGADIPVKKTVYDGEGLTVKMWKDRYGNNQGAIYISNIPEIPMLYRDGYGLRKIFSQYDFLSTAAMIAQRFDFTTIKSLADFKANETAIYEARELKCEVLPKYQ